jgi:hypothetical protein
MAIVDHHALALRFSAALSNVDQAQYRALVTEDFITDWPQSGERVRGVANLFAIFENYPTAGGRLANDTSTVKTQAADGVRLVAPTYTFVAVEGGGNTGTFTLKAKYPDGSIWWVINLYRLRDGRYAHTTTFFAPEYPAPEWRAQWVERM